MHGNLLADHQQTVRLEGFDHLMNTCRRFGLAARLEDPASENALAGPILGQSLDPALHSLMRRANGGVVWELFLYGVGNPDSDLRILNESKRQLRSDLRQLPDFMLFCKLFYRPEYLATIPSLAGPDGLQPVVYLDLNEGIRIAPLASGINRTFELVARCLESMLARYGSVEDGASEERFPWDFPYFVAADEDLLAMLASGKLDGHLSRDPQVIGWLEQLRGRPPAGLDGASSASFSLS